MDVDPATYPYAVVNSRALVPRKESDPCTIISPSHHPLDDVSSRLSTRVVCRKGLYYAVLTIHQAVASLSYIERRNELVFFHSADAMASSVLSKAKTPRSRPWQWIISFALASSPQSPRLRSGHFSQPPLGKSIS